jgi:hypothetical protein
MKIKLFEEFEIEEKSYTAEAEKLLNQISFFKIDRRYIMKL